LSLLKKKHKKDKKKKPLIKIKIKFILFLIYYFLKLLFEIIKELLLKETNNNKIKLYLFILTEILFDLNIKKPKEYF
jgi:hypothetical protein